MPYIVQERRKHLLKHPEAASTPGELNFIFYSKMLEEWKKSPCYDTVHRIAKSIESAGEDDIFYDAYAAIWEEQLGLRGGAIFYGSDLMAALNLAFAEFYRRIVAPYEDKKILENGDVK